MAPFVSEYFENPLRGASLSRFGPFRPLALLARHPGRVYSRAQLLDLVWGYRHEGSGHTVNSHINRLRSKIEPDLRNPRYVETVRGVGYRFSDVLTPGARSE